MKRPVVFEVRCGPTSSSLLVWVSSFLVWASRLPCVEKERKRMGEPWSWIVWEQRDGKEQANRRTSSVCSEPSATTTISESVIDLERWNKRARRRRRRANDRWYERVVLTASRCIDGITRQRVASKGTRRSQTATNKYQIQRRTNTARSRDTVDADADANTMTPMPMPMPTANSNGCQRQQRQQRQQR